MMKWLSYLVLAVLVALSWQFYSQNEKEIKKVEHTLIQIKDVGDPNDEEKIAKIQADLTSKENDRTLKGVVVTILCAGLVGIFFVFTALPFFAQRLSQGMIGSNEKVEKDVMHAARSLKAQGNYDRAITAFIAAAAADPMNRVPWMEIAKIQKDHLEDPAAAIQTIRHALESQEWSIDDATYFLFRLAELYDDTMGDRANAVAVLQQVIVQFPETRHSANANNKLKEWSSPTVSKATSAAAISTNVADEEAEFLARLRRAEAAEQAGGPERKS